MRRYNARRRLRASIMAAKVIHGMSSHKKLLDVSTEETTKTLRRSVMENTPVAHAQSVSGQGSPST